MQTHLTMRYLHNKEAKYSTVLPQIGCFFVPELTCLKLSQLATLETAEELNNLIMKPVILVWQNLGDQNPSILAQDGERSIDVKSRESIIIILKFLSVRLHNLTTDPLERWSGLCWLETTDFTELHEWLNFGVCTSEE